MSKMKLINLYGFVYKKGTAIYRDKELKNFFGYDSFHAHRKSKTVTYNNWNYYLNIIKK